MILQIEYNGDSDATLGMLKSIRTNLLKQIDVDMGARSIIDIKILKESDGDKNGNTV